jgi:hypothetical protein
MPQLLILHGQRFILHSNLFGFLRLPLLHSLHLFFKLSNPPGLLVLMLLLNIDDFLSIPTAFSFDLGKGAAVFERR